jgi:hypothetical protein
MSAASSKFADARSGDTQAPLASPVQRLLDGYVSAERSLRDATALAGHLPRPLKWWLVKTGLRRRVLKTTGRILDTMDSNRALAAAAMSEADQLAVARFYRKLQRGRGVSFTATRTAAQSVSMVLNVLAILAPSVALAIEKTPGIRVAITAASSVIFLFLFGQGEAFARRVIGMPGEEPLLPVWRKNFATKGVYTLELMVLRSLGMRPRRVVPLDLILKAIADLYIVLIGVALEMGRSKAAGWGVVAVSALVFAKLVFVGVRRSWLRRRLWKEISAAVPSFG